MWEKFLGLMSKSLLVVPENKIQAAIILYIPNLIKDLINIYSHSRKPHKHLHNSFLPVLQFYEHLHIKKEIFPTHHKRQDHMHKHINVLSSMYCSSACTFFLNLTTILLYCLNKYTTQAFDEVEFNDFPGFTNQSPFKVSAAPLFIIVLLNELQEVNIRFLLKKYEAGSH